MGGSTAIASSSADDEDDMDSKSSPFVFNSFLSTEDDNDDEKDHRDLCGSRDITNDGLWGKAKPCL